MNEDRWRDWLISANIRKELADKYAKVLVENEFDEVQLLETLPREDLVQVLGMKAGSAAKIRRHFSASSSASTTSSSNATYIEEGCMGGGVGCSSRGSNAGAIQTNPLSYQWEWQQPDGKHQFWTTQSWVCLRSFGFVLVLLCCPALGMFLAYSFGFELVLLCCPVVGMFLAYSGSATQTTIEASKIRGEPHVIITSTWRIVKENENVRLCTANA